MIETGSLIQKIAARQDFAQYADLHWEGSFEDYLRIARENPKVCRTAFQRLYDMILSYGREEYMDAKKKLVRYPFFRDERRGARRQQRWRAQELVAQRAGAGSRPRRSPRAANPLQCYG